MTECNQNEFVFAPHFSRQVSARFSKRQLSTEGGALLLRETDRKIGLLCRVQKCFSDYRHPALIEHELGELLGQRIYGLALGYEDLNDHEELRRDPLLALLAGKRKLEEPLADKSTLNRLELTRLTHRSTIAITKSPTPAQLWMACWSTFFWNRTPRPRVRLCSIWT